MKSAVAVAIISLAAAQRKPWPECVEQSTVMRHVGVAGLFIDLRHFGIFSGCSDGDCSYTDKGHVETVEDCPRLCAQVGEKCLWWSVGDHGGSRLTCHLRKSDNGREGMEHSHAGERYCVPPGTRLQPDVPPHQAAS
jgi:hypothetical protein